MPSVFMPKPRGLADLVNYAALVYRAVTDWGSAYDQWSGGSSRIRAC
jgi:hypothetical protein